MTEVIAKDVNKHYHQDKDMENLFRYISGMADGKEGVRYYSGKGVPKDPSEAAEKMIKVQKHFGKAKQRRVYHYVFSFPDEVIDVNSVKLAADDLATVLFERHQVYYGIHEDTDNLHIHIAFNAVSYVDGKKWHNSKGEFERSMKELKEKVKKTMQEYK